MPPSPFSCCAYSRLRHPSRDRADRLCRSPLDRLCRCVPLNRGRDLPARSRYTDADRRRTADDLYRQVMHDLRHTGGYPSLSGHTGERVHHLSDAGPDARDGGNGRRRLSGFALAGPGRGDHEPTPGPPPDRKRQPPSRMVRWRVQGADGKGSRTPSGDGDQCDPPALDRARMPGQVMAMMSSAVHDGLPERVRSHFCAGTVREGVACT